MIGRVIVVLAAAGFVAFHQAPDSHASCDQLDVTACYWSVEIDGRTFDVKGCAYEDGNPDGLPCVWRDPDTGNMFYNDGSNYQ